MNLFINTEVRKLNSKIFQKACPSLREIINPEKYSGPQGIRANDQLSSKEVDSSLRIPRKKYYTSHSEDDKTPDTKYEYYKPPNYRDTKFWAK